MFRIQSGLFRSEIWYVRVNEGDWFQMLIFYIINSNFNCKFRFEFFCFNSSVHTKMLKILVKGCKTFIDKELLWKLYWYLIYHFSSFWEALCYWFERNQLLFNLFSILMLLFHGIHQFFFWLFENLIRIIKLVLMFGLKAIFRR